VLDSKIKFYLHVSLRVRALIPIMFILHDNFLYLRYSVCNILISYKYIFQHIYNCFNYHNFLRKDGLNTLYTNF